MTAYNPKDYSNYRYKRAQETISEIKVHIQNGFYNTAINRMYYACFYAVGALLVINGTETSSHSGTRQKFGQLFVVTGKFDKELAKHYTLLFEYRHKGDYNDFFDFDKESVQELLPYTENFIRAIGNILNQK